MINDSFKDELLDKAIEEHKAHNFLEAKALYLQVTKLVPEDFYVLYLLGTLEIDLQNYKLAIPYLEESLSLNDEHVDTYLNLAFIYTSVGRYKNALEIYDKAVNLKDFDIKKDEHEKIIRRFARVCVEVGDKSKAIKLYKKILKYKPDDFQIYNLLHEMKEIKFNKLIKNKIKKFLNSKKKQYKNHAQAKFLLSKYEREKQNFKSEFLLLKDAHDIIYENNKERFTNVTNFYLNDLGNLSKSYDHSIELKNNLRKREAIFPIFIVGIPRSGSTILEKVISGGSNKLLAGEETAIMHILFDEIFKNKNFKNNIDRISEAVIDQYEKNGLINFDSNHYFIDKSLENFFCLGWIIKIFPNAKIVNIKRDPMASIVSIFRRNLFNTSWAHKIEDICKYVNKYYELMYEWEYKFHIPVYHLHYEKFIDNFDDETKLLFSYLNIDWHEGLKDINEKGNIVSKTASTLQIREPVYNKISNDYKELSKFIVKNLEQYEWFQHNKL